MPNDPTAPSEPFARGSGRLGGAGEEGTCRLGFAWERVRGPSKVWPKKRKHLLFLGVDSSSILFNHRSFQKADPFSLGFRRFSRKIRSPWVQNGEGTPRLLGIFCWMDPNKMALVLLLGYSKKDTSGFGESEFTVPRHQQTLKPGSWTERCASMLVKVPLKMGSPLSEART